MLVLMSRVMLVCWLIAFTHAYMEQQQDEEELDPDSVLPDLRYLYEEPTHYIDPNDMLADVASLRKSKKSGSPTADAAANKLDQQIDGGKAFVSSCSTMKHDLQACNTELDLLQKQLQRESAISEKLHRKLSEEGAVNYEPFYRRTLTLLWKSLNLQDGLSSVNAGGVAGVNRQVSVYASASTLAAMARCLHHSTATDSALLPQQCDEAVSSLLQGVSLEPEHPGAVTRFLHTIYSYQHSTTYLEICMYCMALVLVSLLFWSATLLVQDLSTTRRWLPFIVLLLVLLFAFCCLWNWRNMVKESESRRAAEWEQRADAAVPQQCKDTGLWSWLWGRDDACKKYYADAFITAAEEITPEVVIGRTATNLFLLPLRALGKEIGHFFKEFYGSVPLLYLLPASVMFLIILVLLLLFLCGYSVHLPLFLGSIGPTPRYQQQPQLDSADHATQYEAIRKQLRDEQHEFLLESRRMMLDINAAVTATAHTVQVVEPIAALSYRTIECQLSQLINTRLTALLEQNVQQAALTCEAHQPSASPARKRRTSEGAKRSSARLTNSKAEDHVDSQCGDTPRKRLAFSSPPLAVAGGGDGVGDGTNCTPDVCKGSAVEDTHDFYSDVCNVLEESLNSTNVSQLEDTVSSRADNCSPRKRSTALGRHSHQHHLSPASKKFLKEVKNALES